MKRLKIINMAVAAIAWTSLLFTYMPAQDLTDEELMAYVEALIIVGRYQKVTDDVLASAKTPSLQYHYFMGICYNYQEKWEDAAKHFRQAMTFDHVNERSMLELSFMGLCRALLGVGDYHAAIDTFLVVTRRYYANLSSDYPRYPNYLDDSEKNTHNIADDAQYFIGECYDRLGEKERARDAFAKVERFYLFSNKREGAAEHVSHLLKHE